MSHRHELHRVAIHDDGDEAVTTDAAERERAIGNVRARVVRTAGAEVRGPDLRRRHGLRTRFEIAIQRDLSVDALVRDADLIQQRRDRLANEADGDLADGRKERCALEILLAGEGGAAIRGNGVQVARDLVFHHGSLFFDDQHGGAALREVDQAVRDPSAR